MLHKINPNFLFRAEIIITSISFILLSIPSFNMTGLIIKPLLLCFCGSVFISIILSFIPKGEIICGYSLLLFCCYWLIYAFIKEFEIQLNYVFPGKWIEFFYFDKLLMVGTIWLSAVIPFVTIRLFDIKTKRNYNKFFNLCSKSFIIFYSFLLIYSFVLIRLERGVYPLNWVPFNTIKEYISDYSSIPYEVFMMFFGNLLYFTPLGVIFYLSTKKYKTLFKILLVTLFPLITFTLLEFSQFVFQNGFCEFDDMMMNSIGFWLGALLGLSIDSIIKKITKGRIDSFWG